eukprot:5413737-Prymnesium_polylepis.1
MSTRDNEPAARDCELNPETSKAAECGNSTANAKPQALIGGRRPPTRGPETGHPAKEARPAGYTLVV